MKFKVGQRVRVIWKGSRHFGLEGTVWKYVASPIWAKGSRLDGIRSGMPAYRVAVDGIGRTDLYGNWIGFQEDDLAPLTDPGFESFMERIQKPLTKPEWEAA